MVLYLLLEEEGLGVGDGDVLDAGEEVDEPGGEVHLATVLEEETGGVDWRNVSRQPEPVSYNDLV